MPPFFPFARTALAQSAARPADTHESEPVRPADVTRGRLISPKTLTYPSGAAAWCYLASGEMEPSMPGLQTNGQSMFGNVDMNLPSPGAGDAASELFMP